MQKLLVVGNESCKNYWLEKLKQENLVDVQLTVDDGEMDADIIFGHEEFVFSLNLDKFTDLKWIQLLSAGVSNPENLSIAKDKTVTTSKGIHGQAMFEYVLYGLLHLNNREIFEQSNFLSWERKRRDLTVSDSQSVLLVGCGSIGSYLASKLNDLGMTVDACVRRSRAINNVREVYESLEQIDLHKYDLVVSSLPITADTNGVFDSKFFSSLSSQAVFVNVGRGETVNEKALEQALATKKIKGAIIDTFATEPVDASSFKLHEYSNCICTPHISGFFNQSHELFLKKFATNYELFLQGKLVSESTGEY